MPTDGYSNINVKTETKERFRDFFSMSYTYDSALNWLMDNCRNVPLRRLSDGGRSMSDDFIDSRLKLAPKRKKVVFL